MATAQLEAKSAEAATTKTSGRAGVPHSPPAAINLGTDPLASLRALRPAALPAAKATLLGVTRPVFFRTELTPAGDDWDDYGGSLKYIPGTQWPMSTYEYSNIGILTVHTVFT